MHGHAFVLHPMAEVRPGWRHPRLGLTGASDAGWAGQGWAMRILKLGGSLAATPALAGWLGAVAEAPGGPWLVVPGGGPFADAVRRLQPQLGFDDLAAHRMAILAMQQYGLHLQGQEPRLRLVEDEGEIRALGPAPGLFLPWRMLGRDTGIRASWAVTSDSLALILAQRLAPGSCCSSSPPRCRPARRTRRRWPRPGCSMPPFPSWRRAMPGGSASSIGTTPWPDGRSAARTRPGPAPSSGARCCRSPGNARHDGREPGRRWETYLG